MTTAIVILGGALLAQYALVFGWSFVVYRFLERRSSNLTCIRNMARLFGGVAAVFVLLVLLMRQLVVRESWAWPYIAPAWVVTIFAVHDLALGFVMRKREARPNKSNAT